jgi:hypothetical protein
VPPIPYWSNLSKRFRRRASDMLEFLGGEGPCSMLIWKSKVDMSSKGQKRKETVWAVMQWDPETGCPLSQVGNRVL